MTALERLRKANLGTEMKIIEPSQYDFDQWNGRLLCFEPPEPGEVYALGVDPAEGVRMDRSVCQVIKMGNMKHPDVQVAEFACDFLDPVDFATVVKAIGDFYHDPDGTEAFLTLEVNAPCGDTMMSDLRLRLDYSNLFIRKSYDKINNIYTNSYGWSTNKASRPKLIARGLHALTYSDLIINSPYLLDEMSDFRRDRFDEKPEARIGRHDDRLMALLIAFYGAHDDEWINGEDIAEQRRAAEKAGTIVEVKQQMVQPGRRVDFQSRPMTQRQMMQEWEDAMFDYE